MDYGGVVGSPHISPLLASAAMAMLFARWKSSHDIAAISEEIVPLNLTPDASLLDIHSMLQSSVRLNIYISLYLFYYTVKY